jgi:DNA-nicking Smr family endonuclease
VNDSDAELWRRFAKGVRPIRRRPPRAPSPDKAAPDNPASDKPIPPTPPAVFAPPPPRPAAVPGRFPPEPANLAPGVAPGLDQRTLQRLKRGLIPPEAEIDLHHLTQEQAHTALARFVIGSQAAGRRCVLVITGKGYGSQGSIGVLKTAVPRWLNEPALRERVLALAHATPAWGGEGALLVLLRRRRL